MLLALLHTNVCAIGKHIHMVKVNVAIYGTNGLLFEPFVKAFSESYKDVINFPIIALTRDASTKTSTGEVQYFSCNADDVDTFKEPMEKADILINTVGFHNWDAPLEAVAKYNLPLKLYFSPQFGSEVDKSFLANTAWNAKFAHSDAWRQKGTFKVIDMLTSFFSFDYFKALGFFDFNEETNVITINGEITDRFDVTDFHDIACSIGELIKLGNKEGFSTLQERIRISSDQISYADAIAKYEKDNGVKVSVKLAPREALIEEAKKRCVNFNPNDLYLFLRAMVATGVDTGHLWSKNDNEYVNPGEKAFKWTKYD